MNYVIKKEKVNLKKNYEIICAQISTSIFSILGFNFFKKLIKDNTIHLYNIKKSGEICAIITVIKFSDYKLINKKIFFHLIKNPFILLQNIFFLIKSLNKNSDLSINKDYIHLLHLIIFSKKFKNISIKKKDLILNNFFKKILKIHKANYIFLCFEKNNSRALRYYRRNKFKIFHKNRNIIYLKKNFNFK